MQKGNRFVTIILKAIEEVGAWLLVSGICLAISWIASILINGE